jgi:hypothetical protein
MLESGLLEFIGFIVGGWILAILFIWLLSVISEIESKEK